MSKVFCRVKTGEVEAKTSFASNGRMEFPRQGFYEPTISS